MKIFIIALQIGAVALWFGMYLRIVIYETYKRIRYGKKETDYTKID